MTSGGFSDSCGYQLLCPAGQYSNVTVSHQNNSDVALDVKCIACPIGRYSDEPGATTSECAGQCDPGYHCPEGALTI